MTTIECYNARKHAWWSTHHVLFLILLFQIATARAFSAGEFGRRGDPTQKDSSSSSRDTTLVSVPKISKTEFDDSRDYYDWIGGENCGRPILVEGVLSSEECHEACENLVAAADDLVVDLQEQPEVGPTKIYEVNLSKAIDIIMRRSNSQKAYFTFCEGLLDEDPSLLKMKYSAANARESIFASDPDLFPEFPVQVQPTDALILAGAGATSTLHRDPMEWTGTSICLEGTKIWRFLEPPPVTEDQHGRQRVLAVDKALDSYRLSSIAWQHSNDVSGKESIALSAGWQSDFSLYKKRAHALIPSARILADLDDDEKLSTFESLNNLDVLEPNIPDDATLTIHTVVQQPGDLLLIPAHWWHQTYAFEPSVAIASQRCGSTDLNLVLDHIWGQYQQQRPGICKEARLYTKQGPQTAIRDFFENLK